MKRRTFLKGMGAVALLPLLPRDTDGVALQSMAHPTRNDYGWPDYRAVYGTPVDINPSALEDAGQRMAEALARSMKQTYEEVTANVLTRAFSVNPS